MRTELTFDERRLSVWDTNGRFCLLTNSFLPVSGATAGHPACWIRIS